MNRARKLAVFAVVITQAAVGVALAQNQGPQPVPPRPAVPPAAPEAAPAAAAPTVKVLTMEEADKLMTEMDTIVVEIEKVLAAARSKGDSLKILCVNDKLTQLKKVRGEAAPMKAGLGNPATQQKASSDLHGSKAKVVKLRTDALVCVGEDGKGGVVITEKGSVTEEGKAGEGPGPGTGPGTGAGFGGLPADPFVSLPPVVTSPTG